ncbi:MAG TPA: helix-turn-helix transcriptional regulator [Streptosporangiaceae bacterium]
MAGNGSPTVRRRELGAALRKLRTDRDWTVEYVAQQLLCSTSKVSRLETGHRGASARDIRDLGNLYGLDDQQRQHLIELASEGKQRAWWQRLGLPYETYVGLEAEAAYIRDYGLGGMPGLLQTPDYARAILRAAVPRWTAAIVEQRVSGRLARQQILSRPDPPRFHAVIDESVLHRVVGSPAVMHAQLTHLLEASERQNVSIGIIPFAAGALPSGNNKFIILGFPPQTIGDVVFIEGLTGDLYLDDPGEIETYSLTFRALSDLAGAAERSRAIITATIRAYAAQIG